MPKKISLVFGNRSGEFFLSLTCPHSRMYIRIYISDWKTQQTKKTKKVKETKEEKRIFVKNLKGYDDIICKFDLCTFYLLDRVVIETVPQKCSVKISQNSKENICARVSFLMKLQASGGCSSRKSVLVVYMNLV